MNSLIKKTLLLYLSALITFVFISGCQQQKPEGILKYKIVAMEDVSYGGTPRMVFRIIVNVNRIPSEDQLKKTAKYIWENGNKGWKEFTVFMYLPDMDTNNAAYGMGEFRPYGLKEFRIQDFALYGTKWK